MIVAYYMDIGPLLAEAVFQQQLSLADRERRERILRLRSAEDRCRSLAGSLLIREGLWRQGIDPDRLRIVENELGKPELDYRFVRELTDRSKGSGVYPPVQRIVRASDRGRKEREAQSGERLLHFSVSHSGRYAVAAFSDRDVGIDVERISRFSRKEMTGRMAQRVLCAEERKMYEKVAQDKQPMVFAWFWTRKEAYVKWDGRGIGMDFSLVDCRKDRMFHTLRLDEDYWVSICAYRRHYRRE